MSSLRNAVKRKTHKERGQTSDRKKYGLLEKHKDYVLRARDFGRKRDRINNLRLKAALRNPDEFYSAMHKTKTEGGVHKIAQDTGLKHDVVQILKTQDLGYVNMRISMDEKKAERMRASLHGVSAPPRNKRTVFVDSEKEVEKFEPAKDDVKKSSKRKRDEEGGASEVPKALEAPKLRARQLRKLEERKASAYRAVEEREKRAAEMRKAMEHLQAQRTLMNSKGTKRKVRDAEGGHPAVFKWKRERTR